MKLNFFLHMSHSDEDSDSLSDDSGFEESTEDKAEGGVSAVRMLLPFLSLRNLDNFKNLKLVLLVNPWEPARIVRDCWKSKCLVKTLQQEDRNFIARFFLL